MTKAFRSVLLFSLLCFLTLGVAWGQNPFNPADAQFTQDFGIDSINLQNLSVNLHAPVIGKTGAIPFSYALEGTSDCEHVTSGINHVMVCGVSPVKKYLPSTASSTLGGAAPAGVWTATPQISQSLTCAADSMPEVKYSNWVLTAPDHATYYFPAADYTMVETGGTSCNHSFTDTTASGGITLAVSGSGTGFVSGVALPNGVIANTNPTMSVTDPFSNAVSFSGTVYTDTLNDAALTVTPQSVGTGEIDTYQDTGGTNQQIKQILTAETFKTNFACGGWADQTTTGYAVTEVDYPDSNNLYFTYEAITGGITGRIHQVTYRTGGTASYTYGSFNCNGTRPSSLTRTTADGATTYTFAANGTNGSTTTVLDPGKNKTIYTFMGTDAGGNLMFGVPLTLTEVQVWQNTNTVASPSYTLLSTTIYCYNGNSTACPTTSAAYPITEKDTYTAPGAKTTYSRTKQLFDSYGNVTTVARYDFTTIGGGTPVETTTTTYGSWNGTNCVAVGSGIVNKPCDITTRDAANNALAESKFTYGTKGFMTSKYDWGGSVWVTTNASANANGTPAWTQNPIGTKTFYGYGCNAMLPTSTSTTVGTATLATAATWDCNMGKLLSATDANSNTSNFTYDLLGRPLSQQDPTLYTLGESYPSATSSTLTDSTYFTTTLTVDGLGRPIRSQKTDGASYDTASTAYAFTAGTNPQWQVSTSQPCITTLGSDCTKNHFGIVDPLGRSISSSTTSNETVASSFNQNDASSTLSPFPSGEHNKTVQTEYDGLGRVISTCTLQTTGGTACGQVDGNSGILTTFAYSSGAWSRTVTATRGSQVHTTVYDPMGRVTSVTTPEAGNTTYVYDTATSTCGSGSAPGVLVETVDNAGTHMCFGVDSIGRTTQAHDPTYSQGCHSWVYGDQSTLSVLNGTNRIVEAYTDADCSGTSKTTDEQFSYDKVGRTLDVWETTLHSGGTYHTQAAYALNGTLASISGVPGKSTYTIGLDPNGRPDKSTYGTTPVATNVNYNGAGQPTEIDYGTDNDLYPRDPNTGLMTGWTFTIGASNEAAILTWNPNRTLKKLAITDGFNSGGTQTCHYNPTDAAGSGYDDVGRLVGVNCGALWTQTYTYDQYNNFSKNGTTNWNPGYSSTNNHITGASYDSDGQVTNDLNNSYAWDGYHKMITANSGASLGSCGSAGVTCVTYDAFGRPAEKNVAGTITEMLYSPIGLTGIMSGQTTNNMRVPIPGGAIFGTSTDGNVVYRRDWLGSVRLAFTLGHAQITDTAFSPYGEKYATFGTSRNLNFTGDYQDLYSGLFDTPNREFDVSSGSRWLSPDPARASWNAYSYPTNPNSFIDPSGLDQKEVASTIVTTSNFYADTSYFSYMYSVDPLRTMGIPVVLDNPIVGGSVTYKFSWEPGGTAFQTTSFGNNTSFFDIFTGMNTGNGLSPIQTAPNLPGIPSKHVKPLIQSPHRMNPILPVLIGMADDPEIWRIKLTFDPIDEQPIQVIYGPDGSIDASFPKPLVDAGGAAAATAATATTLTLGEIWSLAPEIGAAAWATSMAYDAVGPVFVPNQ